MPILPAKHRLVSLSLLMWLVFSLTPLASAQQTPANSARAANLSIGVLALALTAQIGLCVYQARKLSRSTKQLQKQKGLLEKVQSDHDLLRQLIDELPDFIYFKDTESRFVAGNRRVAENMRARHQMEILGKTDFDFYPQDLARKYFADEQRVIKTGEPLLQVEEPVVDDHGNQIWASTSKIPLRGWLALAETSLL
jgi:PAS domain S-box-containing protein